MMNDLPKQQRFPQGVHPWRGGNLGFWCHAGLKHGAMLLLTQDKTQSSSSDGQMLRAQLRMKQGISAKREVREDRDAGAGPHLGH